MVESVIVADESDNQWLHIANEAHEGRKTLVENTANA